MPDVELTRKADHDLQENDQYTAEHFGESWADALRAQFRRSFELIAQYPLIGSDCAHIRRGVRRLVVEQQQSTTVRAAWAL